MTSEPITVQAIINGEKIQTEKNFSRENPTHPDEVVGYAPVNTREEAVSAIEAAYHAFKGWLGVKLMIDWKGCCALFRN